MAAIVGGGYEPLAVGGSAHAVGAQSAALSLDCTMPTDFTPDITGRIARLFIHPIKSCAGTELREAELTPTGLAWDRSWMVVDDQGMFMTQREWPRMALIHPVVGTDTLTLRASGMADLELPLAAAGRPCEVQVWRDRVQALDASPEAARWLSEFLQTPCRLVRFDDTGQRLADADWTQGAAASVRFPDGFPLLVVSQAALDELNERLRAAGHAGVGMERFRPNIVIDGFAAHDEDHAELLHVSGGAVALRPVKPCARCPIPDVDPATAQRGTAVTEQLRAYRQDARVGGGLTFGMNAIIAAGAGQTLRVGQQVAAQLSF